MDEQSFGAFARDLKNEISSYVNARIEYAKLLAYERIAKFTGSASVILVLVLLGFFTFFFFSFTAALVIGRLLKDEILGYTIVSAIYLILVILIYSFRRQIEDKIVQKMVKSLLEGDESRKESSKETTSEAKFNETAGKTTPGAAAPKG